MKFLTKRNSTVIFLLVTASFVFLQGAKVSQICTDNGVRDWTCTEYLGVIKALLFLASVLSVPLIVTLPLSPNVFDAWKKFAIWAAPSVFAVVIALSFVETGGGIGGMVEQRMLATAIIGLYVAYAAASLAVIGTSWWKSRKQ